jgi:hypothetical protein
VSDDDEKPSMQYRHSAGAPEGEERYRRFSLRTREIGLAVDQALGDGEDYVLLAMYHDPQDPRPGDYRVAVTASVDQRGLVRLLRAALDLAERAG